MAEPTVTPTPTAHPNAPAPVAETPKPPAAEPESAILKRTTLAYHKALRDQSELTRKVESERKTAAETATELASLKKRDEMARLNPPAFLQQLYGDKWHEMINEAKLNGVAPAQLVAAEIQKVRDEFAARDKARDEEAAKGRDSAKSQATEQARRSIFADAAQFYRAKAADFPLLAKLGGETHVARTIAQRIESEFHRTTETDAEGNVTRQGKVLTPAEAADLIESDVIGWASEATKHEKYKSKLQPPPASSTVTGSKQGTQQQNAQQQPARQGLTNQITGSTSPPKPPLTAKERRERAVAAYEANRRK